MSITHTRHPDITPNRPIHINLIGAGGTGSRMLFGLANMNATLCALGWEGIQLNLIDPDTVSHSNLARGPFYPSDQGIHKSIVLINRVNIAHGIKWKAVVENVEEIELRAQIVISCVDTKKARASIHKAVKSTPNIHYWLDTGNTARTGQYLIGEPHQQPNNPKRLPTISEMYPEIIDAKNEEPDAPSCSALEALERQDLGINDVIASQALAMLWNLLRHGKISHAGGFINLETGTVMPILVN
jgi:sulfur-carrier protein adenylyltransferase/sulfurtransferase